jgi:2-polyprenyl-3-methyl-5-hydroxy-6-metoxy-1,4-benzoquinol methylase
MLAGPVPGEFDAAYALDVLEHIVPHDEHQFIANMLRPLTPEGVAIFGMPSLESQPHASPQSKAGHVNCKSGEELKATLEQHFHSVFIFSMNDEVVHTGFYPMAHYLLALCCHRRSTS